MELTDGAFVSSTQEEKLNYAAFYTNDDNNKTYILIMCPGQQRSEVRRPMQEVDKLKYPQAWNAFQNKTAAPVVGTPVNYLPGISLALLKQLKQLNVLTIEQLANVPDQNIGDVGLGAQELRTKAQAFLAKNSEEVLHLRQMVANLTAKVEQLQADREAGNAVREATLAEAMLESRAADVNAQLSKVRRGRPPKAALAQ